MANRRRKKGLSSEDSELWRKVAKTVSPMHQPKQKEPIEITEEKEPPLAMPMGNPFPSMTPKLPKPQPTPDKLRALTIGGKSSARSHSAHKLKRTVTEDVTREPLNMDARKHKRMLQGREAPEARIDLHGMTVAQAHPALINFIKISHARGLRLVLVITGKGKDKDEGYVIPTQRGVLRNQVPSWLRSPEMNGIVQQVRQSHRSHGGQGAYYVHLNRRK